MPKGLATGLVTVFLATACGLQSPPANAVTCSTGNRPGATLLIPYFEVDLDDPQGRDTFFSVGNAGLEPALAHVVLWTDLGVPTLAFDVFLDANGTQSLSLRSILSAGRLPATGDSSTSLWFPSCTAPLTPPALDTAALLRLQARHTGRPDPDDGLCYGTQDHAPHLAVGYVTVDVVRDCSDSVRFPTDRFYFEENPSALPGDTGLVSPRNVLWGDVLLVHSKANSAQGFAAIPLRYEGDLLFPTFWEDESGGRDRRRGLGRRSRLHYFNGGAFDGGTDVVIWNQGWFFAAEPTECAALSSGLQDVLRLSLRFSNEAGEVLSEYEDRVVARTARRRIGATDLPAPSPFGFLEVRGKRLVVGPTLPGYAPMQSLVVPLLQAGDRFSVALAGTEVEGTCPEPAASPSEGSKAYTMDGATLYESDLRNGTHRGLRTLHSIGNAAVTDMAVVDGQRLFGILDRASGGSSFVSVDLPTDQVLFEVALSGAPLSHRTGAVEVDPQGRLWLLWGDELRQADPDSGATLRTVVVAEEIGQLVSDEQTLYGFRIEGGEGRMVRLDSDTGDLELLFTVAIGDGGRLRGADFDAFGNLWLLTGTASRRPVQRFYRLVLDRAPELLRPELTVEELIDFGNPPWRPSFLTLSMQEPAAPSATAGASSPAASLFVPYFEVDLEAAGGRDTLFSVNNAAAEPVLVNVVLWTDWGIPSLSFPLYLGAGAGRVFDLRRFFVDAALPVLDSAAAELHPGCGPFVGPAVHDPSDLAARHTGQPSTADGLCHGAPRGDAVATGFITVDVVRDCSADFRSPQDDGYFGANGVAGDDNVLWGEVFLIDESSDAAQAFAAVALPADSGLAPGEPTFYGRSDNRRPLGCEARGRYFESGVFEGGTELLVWSAASPVGAQPKRCAAPPSCPVFVEVSSRAEAGGLASHVVEIASDRQTQRLAVGPEPLPVSNPFGSLDVQTRQQAGGCGSSLLTLENVGTWMLPLTSARGRFGVAVEAVDLGGACR